MSAADMPFEVLAARRRELGIPFRALAESSGVSQPVVQRLLSGKLLAPRFPTVVAIARALGVRQLRIMDDGSVRFESVVDARRFREQQALRKAKKLVGMVQSTSALEGQAVSADDYRAMVERTVCELIDGSNHRLWSE
jgi:transcriptional regulator with XRE-family HTH domain